jgi:UDP:flavonoid glycosyltransferase YjiC (YdhE family)
MRVLVTANGATGHLRPMLGLAQGLDIAGLEAIVVTDVAATGSPEFGDLPSRVLPNVDAEIGFDGASFTESQISRAPAERSGAALRYFLAKSEAWLPTLIELIDELRPEVIVRESTFWGSWLAGELTGTPVATFNFHPPGPSSRIDVLSGGEGSAARARAGLPADPELSSMDRWLTLVGLPARWIGTDQPLRPTTHLIQPPEPHTADDRSVDELFAGLPDRPTVYVTLGTTFNGEPGVFEMVLEGLHDVQANVIATTGRSIDPASFGRQPEHVRLTRYVPQGPLLSRCDAVVAHGGYGSLMGALSHGLPVVSVPLAASDNATNAARLEQLGAGLAVHHQARSPRAVTEAVRAVLDDECYRVAARALADEIAALPSPAEAARMVEQLGETRAPVESPWSVRPS